MGKSIKSTTMMGMLIFSMLSLSACGQKAADEEKIKQEVGKNRLQEGERAIWDTVL